MTAFKTNPITDSYSYLRQHAQRFGCNPCFDHVPKDQILRMNEKGRDEILYCDQKSEFQCPCGGLAAMLEEDGKCWKDIFRRIEHVKS
jgi:hypothetical protein